MSRPALTPTVVLAVAAGGAVGGALRFALSSAADTHVLWMTLAINALGCFCLALLPAIRAVQRSRPLTVALGPGLLGGFTTLSAYAEQGRALVADGRPGLALGYWLGTLAVCLGGVWLARRVTTTQQRASFEAAEGDE